MTGHDEKQNSSHDQYTTYDLPAYSYVTGHHPHPLRDPKGHGCPGPDEPKKPPTQSDWQTCTMYLWGIDLFNAGFYWESHEAWEAVWHAAGRKGPTADFLKALIKLAAAGVKARENRPIGIERHSRRAVELLDLVASEFGSDRYLGLSIAELRRAAGEFESNAKSLAEKASSDIAAHVLPLCLQAV